MNPTRRLFFLVVVIVLWTATLLFKLWIALALLRSERLPRDPATTSPTLTQHHQRP